ncbi:hypothetical protein HK102_012892 [Quaeritorhiza haematococci]|nr:hypothetical protein HK102_012892 [Quaeritorhiza haematococci]
MSRHSKNNTALAFFTHAEKQKLDYGTQKSARDPLCCTKGHLACKECIYENILAQKKEIVRQQKLYESQKKRLEEEQLQKELEKKEAELIEFQKQQTRFLPEGMSGSSKVGEDGKVYKPVKTARGHVYVPDVEANEAQDKLKTAEALKELEKKAKPVLPSFWVPALTPAAAPDEIKEVKKETVCTATEQPHPISVKKFVTVQFTVAPTDRKSNDEDVKAGYMCPACLKTFTNGSKIASTGFAAGGGNVEVTKKGTAFQ